MTADIPRIGTHSPVVQNAPDHRVTFRRAADGALLVRVREWRTVTHRRGQVGKAGGYPRNVTHEAPIPAAEFIPPPQKPNRSRITCALDLCGLYGPEVDEALGVEEPAVDEWETGARVPTAEQVGRLATLTGFRPEWFYGLTLPQLDPVFICPGGGYRPKADPALVDELLGGDE